MICKRNSEDPLLKIFLSRYGLNLLSVPRTNVHVGDVFILNGSSVSTSGNIQYITNPPLHVSPNNINEHLVDIEGKISNNVDYLTGVNLLDSFLSSLGANNISGNFKTEFKKKGIQGLKFFFNDIERDSVDVLKLGADLIDTAINSAHPLINKNYKYYIVTAVVKSSSISIKTDADLNLDSILNAEALKLLNLKWQMHINKSDDGEITFLGDKKNPLVFGVQVYEMVFDLLRDRIRLTIPDVSIKLMSDAAMTEIPSATFIGADNGNAFINLEDSFQLDSPVEEYSYLKQTTDILVGNRDFNFSEFKESKNVSDNPKTYYIISEFDEQVKAGSQFTVDIFLSRKQGKNSSPVLQLQEEWQIDILIIPKSGVDLKGEFFQSIIVRQENLNKKLHFILEAREEGLGSFIVTARYQGKELFHEEYAVTILPSNKPVSALSVSKKMMVKGQPGNASPDLTLLITTCQENGKLILKYFLHSPDSSLNLTYKNFQIILAQHDVGAFFMDFFNDIDTIKQDNKQQRLDAVEIMKSKGAKLYRDLFPEDFRRILWNIHDKIKSIVINSDEPWIPWEMCFMYPEETGITDGIFLCEGFEISRWISGTYSPITEISLTNAAIVIPGDSKLLFPPSEKEGIETTLESINAKLTEVTASYQDVRKSFLSGNYNLWHFSGHGTDSSGTNSSRYKILLENGDAFSPDDITGMKTIGKGKPIIFFNACQASKPGLGLTGLSGWPKQFIDNNVSAFIGAYWSVVDETACKLAVKFYELLATGEPIAAALKKARLHVKDEGNPTWLAYTLYADPFAKISSK